MPNAVLERIATEQSEIETFISTLMEQAATESRDLVATELETIRNYEARLAQLGEQAAPIVAYEARRASAVDLARVTTAPRATAPAALAETRSLGDIFTSSEQFRAYTGRGSSGMIEVPEFRAVGPDPLLLSTAPGNVLASEAQKIRVQPSLARFPLLDYVGRLEVTSNAVSLVTVGDASGADVVAEGAAKPPVVWTASEVSVTLEMVAGWFKASRQALLDITGLRNLIDAKIRRAIDKKLAELASTALGTAKVAGNTVTGAAKASMAEVVRIAIAELEGNGNTPNAVFVNPADAAAFDILMLGKPLGVAQVNGGMWGLPIVPVPQLTAGTAVVGDMSEALWWIYRTGLNMYVTDSDVSDAAAGAVTSDFRHNIVTFLGEVMGKFAVADASAIRFAVTTP